ADLAEAVAPGLGELGVMLPSTPLHHLLMRRLGFPVVATSGNIAGAPMEVEIASALVRLGGIADAFLVHDRPIERPVDDSLVRVVLGRRQILRRGRGFAPLPLPMPGASSPSEHLALGGMLKNTVAYGVGGSVVVGGHIGDLDDLAAVRVHRAAAADLVRLFGAAPVARRICCDLHPDYESTRTALELTATPVRVQHHLAHLAGVMAEHELAPPVLGFVWDGAGLGLDGAIWGGECFLVEADGSVRRRATLRPFRLLGGDNAAREPRRVLLGMLGEIFGPGFGGLEWLSELGFSVQELVMLGRMLARGVCSPWCSSMGRLFDAIAALSGLCLTNRFEGQAAMLLEGAIWGGSQSVPAGGNVAPLPRIAVASEFAGLPWAPEAWLDWGPLLERLLADGRPGPEEASGLLHAALVATVVAIAG
ncbi:MAG TPA: carbamoyltransferase HypF, partial [Verrucomicrobia bacterium]|nr:carbamoyltransferase HypF [Verrucomicrobiota bacterium]